MGKSEEDILRGLRQMMQGPDITFPAVVKDNYPGKDYCDVIDINGTEFPEVRLRSAIDSGKGIIITPSKNSAVIVSRIQGSDSLYISMVSEIDSIQWTLNNHVILFDKNGYSFDVSSGKFELKNSAKNLLDLFLSIADIISNLKVPTPDGLSSTPFPDTIQAVEQFKQDTKSLLK